MAKAWTWRWAPSHPPFLIFQSLDMETQEILELQPNGKSSSLKVSSFSSSFFIFSIFFLLWKRQWQQCCRHHLFLFVWEENDGIAIMLFCPCFVVKKMMTNVVIFLFSIFDSKKDNNKLMILCFFFKNEFTTLREKNIIMYIMEEKLKHELFIDFENFWTLNSKFYIKP